jgi:hypothetical protein
MHTHSVINLVSFWGKPRLISYTTGYDDTVSTEACEEEYIAEGKVANDGTSDLTIDSYIAIQQGAKAVTTVEVVQLPIMLPRTGSEVLPIFSSIDP